MKKRILSLLLAFVMIIGMIPTNSFTVYATEWTETEQAATTESEETTPPTTEAPVEEEKTPPSTEAPEEETTPVKVETAVVQDTAALAEATYEVYVGGVGMANGTYLANNAAVTTTDKPSGGYAYYADGVLTLNNYSYSGEGIYVEELSDYTLIYSETDVSIKLIGDNTISSTGTGTLYDPYGISASNIEISEDSTGKLTLSGTSYGFSAFKNVKIHAGTIEIKDAYGGIYASSSVWLDGGCLELDAESFGLLASNENVVILDGTVNIKSNGYGIYGCEDTDDYYGVDIQGGKVVVESNENAIESVSTISITGGSVDAKSTNTEEDSSYYALYGDNVILGTSSTVRVSTEPDGTLSAYDKYAVKTYDRFIYDSEYNVCYVGGVGMADGDYLANNAAVTTTDKPSGGYAYYADGILTLNNYSYSGEGIYVEDLSYNTLIYSETDVIIKLVGENTLTSTSADADGIKAPNIEFTEDSSGKLTISGTSYGIAASKVVEVHAGTIDMKDTYGGIYAGSCVWIDGGFLEIDSSRFGLLASNENVVILDGTVNIKSNGYGIYGCEDTDDYYGVDIQGGKVVVESNENAIESEYTISITGGIVDAKSTNTEEDSSYYALAGDDIILGTKVSVRASTEPDGTLDAYNKYAVKTYDRIVVGTVDSVFVGGVEMVDGEYLANDATSTTTSKPSGGYAYYKDDVLTLNNYSYSGEGIYVEDLSDYTLIYSETDVSIKLIGDNTISSTGTGTLYDPYGISASNIEITEDSTGKLTLSGVSYGVSALKNVKIHAGTLEIKNAYGCIYADSSVWIDGGCLELDAEEFGLFASDENVVILDGTVNIKSNGYGIYGCEDTDDYYGVDIQGGKVVVESNENAIESVSTISITGGSVDAKSTNTEKDSTYCSLYAPYGDIIWGTNVSVQASTEPEGTLYLYINANSKTYDRVVVGPYCDHVFDAGVVTTEPSCEIKGVKTYTCENCGAKYTQEIKEIGHDYDNGVVTTEPGCETKGVKTYTCGNCGETYTEDIDATGHDYDDGVVTTEPSCETEGVKTYTCKNGCGIPKTEAIEALEHTWDEGEIIHPATVDKEGEKRYTCLVCSNTKTETIPKLVLLSKAISYDGNGALSGEHKTEYILETYTYTLPECNFTPQPGQIFRCWRVKGVDMQPGESFVVETDTVITAIWRDMTVFVGGVEMDDGYYLATGSSTPTTTKPSDGYAFYDDGKLVLNNYTYTGFGVQFSGINHAAIFSAKTLDIELIGTNTLTLKQDDDHLPIGIVLRDDNSSMEIRGEGALSITGGGTAIEARKGGTITVHSGTITTDCDGTGIKSDLTDFVMNGGNVTLVSKQATGMMAGSITVNGGTLDVTGAPYGQGIASQNGDITINGGKVIVRCNDGDGNDDENYALRVASAGKLVIADKMNVQASTQYDGTLGDFVEADYKTYDRVVIEEAIIRTVTFMVDSTVYKTEKVKDKTLVAQPADPELDGWKFLGWYTEDDEPFNFNLYIEEDTVIYAKFEDVPATYTVYFFWNKDDEYTDIWREVEAGQTASPPEDFAPEGFLGWYTEDDELYDFTAPVTEDIRLYAKFETVADDITVTPVGDIDYTVDGNKVTVKHEAACKVGYLNEDGKYVAVPATKNADGSYSYELPEGVTEAIVVVKGDLSGDGKFLANDKAAINAALSGKITLSAEKLFAADITGDGKFLANDKAAINAILAGKISLSW